MVKLRDEIKTEKMVEVVERPALYAKQCDACRKIFEMDVWCNEAPVARLGGTFTASTAMATGRLGNMFEATVCSFACADKLFTGGWRDMPNYKPFVEADCRLVRASVQLTALMRTE